MWDLEGRCLIDDDDELEQNLAAIKECSPSTRPPLRYPPLHVRMMSLHATLTRST